jgi:hypothetical protein
MGKVNRYFVANGMSQLIDVAGRNVSPFSNMDGELQDNIEFSEVRGKRRLKKRKPTKRKKTWGKVLDYTPIGMAKKGVDALTSEEAINRRAKKQELRQGRRERRLSIKEKQANTQTEIAKTLNQTSPTDEALTKALTETTPVTTDATKTNTEVTDTTTTGMSKRTKTILIVGGVVIALTATILIIRKMRKK